MHSTATFPYASAFTQTLIRFYVTLTSWSFPAIAVCWKNIEMIMFYYACMVQFHKTGQAELFTSYFQSSKSIRAVPFSF